MNKYLLLLFTIIIISCKNDDDIININLSDFEEGRDYDFKKFNPSTNINYWDYINECSIDKQGNYKIEILHSVGDNCNSEECQKIYNQNNISHPIYDFIEPCDDCCTDLIRYEKNGKVNVTRVFSSNIEIFKSDFLGEIDNIDEAIWILKSNRYTLTNPQVEGYMKTTSNGYEFIALISTSYQGEPFKLEKHHLKMNFKGVISILKKEIVYEE